MAGMVPREEEYKAATGPMLGRCEVPGWPGAALRPSCQLAHWHWDPKVFSSSQPFRSKKIPSFLGAFWAKDPVPEQPSLPSSQVCPRSCVISQSPRIIHRSSVVLRIPLRSGEEGSP